MIKKSVLKGVVATNGSELTTLYTVPTGKKAELVMVWITNPDSGNRDFHLEIYNSVEDETIVVLDDYPLNDREILQLGGTANSFVILYQGDTIKARGSNNSNFKVVLSIIEHNHIVDGG